MSTKLKVFATTVEETAEAQIKQMNECEAYGDCKVRIMPDCHAGKGCTIGTVIEVKNRIVPNTVGVDIGCGMYVCPIKKGDIDVKRLDEVIHEFVPSGFSVHDTPIRHDDRLSQLICAKSVKMKYAQQSIGTLGGGNHFIELNEGSDGTHYLVIHSGSRNLGVTVCDHYQKIAEGLCGVTQAQRQELIDRLKAEGRQREIPTEMKKLQPIVKDMTLAYLDGIAMDAYLHDMEICQSYARRNRETMAEVIADKMDWEYDEERDFHTIHNYIDTVQMILRKGAVSAEENERLIIPMNMRDGSLLCIGKGNDDWLCSAPHGAGRLMSRKQAFDTLKMEDFTDTMSNVYSTSICPETIDESPMAYKPMQEIIDAIGDTVEIIDIIKPIYNFKAKNGK